MDKTSFSVIIPAHNEEKYVARCIQSIKVAGKLYGRTPEIIVVCNRCTDRTSEIAAACGAKVVEDESRCIGHVRNTGIRAASGNVIVTIDCDNRMTRGTLVEIEKLLSTGLYIGGGAPIRMERRSSFPLRCNEALCQIGFRLTGLYCGIFWAEKKTFEAVGGFSEIKVMEDVETAKKLKRLAARSGKQYTVLRHNYLINSTRKFDQMGDWLYAKLLIQNANAFLQAALGNKDKLNALLDTLFYDYNG